MADLLSTALLAYALLTVAGWRIEWLDRRWVVLGVAGTAIPDLLKIRLLLDSSVVEAALGVPFDWAAFATLAGVLLVAGLLTLAFARRHWRRVYPLLVAGGSIGLLTDGLRVFADGRADFYLFPLWWRPPTPSLFVSSDPRVLVVALALAAVVFVIDWRAVGSV